MVTIPGVRLLSTDDAVKKLEDLDLVVTVERNTDFPIPLNIASGTDPAEGSEVPVGSEVTLYVA
ncbi:PASTA domain-containing protein [Tessaracoccus flavus]